MLWEWLSRVDWNLLWTKSFRPQKVFYMWHATHCQNHVEAKRLEPVLWNFAWTNGRLYAFWQILPEFPKIYTLDAIKVLLVTLDIESRVSLPVTCAPLDFATFGASAQKLCSTGQRQVYVEPFLLRHQSQERGRCFLLSENTITQKTHRLTNTHTKQASYLL